MFKASESLSASFHNKSSAELLNHIYQNYCVDESAYLQELLDFLAFDDEGQGIVHSSTRQMIEVIRASDRSKEGVEAFLQEYSLDTEEGIVLMCLAEALLRIPDPEVANDLIKSKLGTADWDKHIGKSESKLVNASTWGLMLTGKIIKMDPKRTPSAGTMLSRLVNKFGEPVIRRALNQAMKLMGKQFVLGETIKEATQRGKSQVSKGYSHSFDMLGEAALTREDAEKYFNEYKAAISYVGKQRNPKLDERQNASISIKLSALHPRYESTQADRVLNELAETVLALLQYAREHQVAITIDAEEADRLEISLALFEKLLRHPCCEEWNNFGIVVQAYSKRALPILVWLRALAAELDKQLPIRLVKGAYWDSEIKWAQQKGLAGYPVFTRKTATDVSYLACAKYMLANREQFYCQFATHNAQTVNAVLYMAKDKQGFEFQRLHGMGEVLYDTLLAQHKELACRIYAPVGNHKDLLPYLVRRLLENGANTSFVHRLVDEKTPIEELAKDPVDKLLSYPTLHNSKIPLPINLFGHERENSNGINLHSVTEEKHLMHELKAFWDKQWQSHALVSGKIVHGDAKAINTPFDHNKIIGQAVDATAEDAEKAIQSASKAFKAWRDSAVEKRADILEKIADKFEQHKMELIALCTLEAGKTIEDGIDEVREAIDFCRYYAMQAKKQFKRITLPGPTGESNHLQLEGRGIFACISPWNFPLAIFTGQISAALVSGNCVLAKPAGQTRLIAYRAVQLMHEAGIPHDVLHYLPGSGSVIGKLLTEHPLIAGVAFTGSTQTAQHINQTLAKRNAAIAPFIAETGGQNAMIVDSSALPEQIVNDLVDSAFRSAGQRCSALRVLYLQKEIAPRVIELLKGALAELRIDEPYKITTDVGPVIDPAAKQELIEHCQELESQQRLVARASIDESIAARGNFVLPQAYEISSMHDLKQEYFGPVLHIIRYQSGDLDKVIAEINSYGYGLTLGIHSRNEETARYIAESANVGNIYINRNMIGATVGVQPFGGQGLSGTGPKAGGPHYLQRFATEKTITNNTAAIGGNATLLSLDDDD